jgi:hypothetical protein
MSVNNLDTWRPFDPYLAGMRHGAFLGYIAGFAMGMFVYWLAVLS